jgi:hypothetical protein
MDHEALPCPSSNKLTQEETNAIIRDLADATKVLRPQDCDAESTIREWLRNQGCEYHRDMFNERDNSFNTAHFLHMTYYAEIDGQSVQIQYLMRAQDLASRREICCKIAYAIEAFGDRLTPVKIPQL